MKIEIGESLCYSYLRHVKRCWLVQMNWKTSEHWDKQKSDSELESLFESMRERFDLDGSVFKQTKDAGQFLKQGEIDVVGVDQGGSVHAMEIAFHEAGLNYGGGVGTRVLKKLLRAVLILKAYHPARKSQLYFASPVVHPAAQQPLEDAFAKLEREYPEIGWHLLTNDTFAEQLVRPTLEMASSVADTSELFARAAKLLELSGITEETPPKGSQQRHRRQSSRRHVAEGDPPNGFQDLLKALMKTLLEDHSTLLEDGDVRDLMDSNYCKNTLGIKISNFPLLRRVSDGIKVSGRSRYYTKSYGAKYYLCSQFWKAVHLHNAARFVQYVDEVIDRRASHPGLAALEGHRAALRKFVDDCRGMSGAR